MVPVRVPNAVRWATRLHARQVASTVAVAGMLACDPAAAQVNDVARVVASVPVVEQAAIPQTRCEMRQVLTRPEPSGGGAVVGAVIGGLLGSTIGQGSGQVAAAALGAAGGAMLGDRNERDAMPTVAQPVQECRTVQAIEPRTVGWNVTYEYGGRQNVVRLPYDPGVGAQLPVRIDVGAPTGGAVAGTELPVSPVPIAGGAPVPPVVPPTAVVPAPYPVVTAPYPYPYGYGPVVVVRPWPVAPVPWVGIRGGWGGHAHGGHRGW